MVRRAGKGGLAGAFTDDSPLGCWPRHLCHSKPMNTSLVCIYTYIYTHIYIYIHRYLVRHHLQCLSWGAPRFWCCCSALVPAPARDALPGAGLPPPHSPRLQVCGVVPTAGCFWLICFCVRLQWLFFRLQEGKVIPGEASVAIEERVFP